MFILFQCRQPSTFYREIDHLFIVIQQIKVVFFVFVFLFLWKLLSINIDDLIAFI